MSYQFYYLKNKQNQIFHSYFLFCLGVVSLSNKKKYKNMNNPNTANKQDK